MPRMRFLGVAGSARTHLFPGRVGDETQSSYMVINIQTCVGIVEVQILGTPLPGLLKQLDITRTTDRMSWVLSGKNERYLH